MVKPSLARSATRELETLLCPTRSTEQFTEDGFSTLFQWRRASGVRAFSARSANAPEPIAENRLWSVALHAIVKPLVQLGGAAAGSVPSRSGA